MAKYILVPDASISFESIPLTARRMGRSARERQIATSASAVRSGGGDQALRSWMDRVSKNGAKVELLTRSDRASVTGVHVIEATEDVVRDMPGDSSVPYVALQDRPIDLIAPERATATHTAHATDDHGWHLDVTEVRSFRAAKNVTGRRVTVAVLDTGVDANHPELAGKISRSMRFDVSRWAEVPDPLQHDTDGHGTHVAGLIAGTNVGVAPDARIVAGIMIPNGRGNLSDFVLAMERAVADPEVQIINVSAGIDGLIPGFERIVQQIFSAGVLLVAAVGNESHNRSRSPGNYREVLSVGAVDKNKAIAAFSGGGRLLAPDQHVYSVPDVVAPGVQVYSSVMGGGYEAWDGTSMAAPIVSGIAALLLEAEPNMLVAELRDRLLSSAANLGLAEDRMGRGLVRAR